MWYGLCILLCSWVCAVDDVFLDMPSQFGGYNYFLGMGVDAQAGEVQYKDCILQGYTDPKLKIEISQQTDTGLWVSGRKFFAAIGGKDHKVYEKLSASTVSVETPLLYGVAYRKGFLFNPSTMVALNLGIGNEHVRYTYVTETVKSNNLFILTGLDMIIGVLTSWGIEMGLAIAASDAKVVFLNTVDKYTPPQYSVTGKVGVVYHKDNGIDF